MNQLAARLTLVITLVLGTAVATLGTPLRALAGHLPPPAEIGIRPGELPPGLEPVAETGTALLLPDGLARQAAASFQRGSAPASEPGVRCVRQVVLAFDDREAVDYKRRARR